MVCPQRTRPADGTEIDRVSPYKRVTDSLSPFVLTDYTNKAQFQKARGKFVPPDGGGRATRANQPAAVRRCRACLINDSPVQFKGKRLSPVEQFGNSLMGGVMSGVDSAGKKPYPPP